MTEKELRQKVVDCAKSYLGLKGNTKELQALYDRYNLNLKQSGDIWGTRQIKMIMSPTWGWCAAFVSTIGQDCGLIEYIPQEIGPWEMVQIAKRNGLWKNAGYSPEPGDIIFYDWARDGKGDVDHVEIVTDAAWPELKIRTVGGNNGEAPGVCSTREVSLDYSEILGFITPNYAQAAQAMTDDEAFDYSGHVSLPVIVGHRNTITDNWLNYLFCDLCGCQVGEITDSGPVSSRYCPSCGAYIDQDYVEGLKYEEEN